MTTFSRLLCHFDHFYALFMHFGILIEGAVQFEDHWDQIIVK